MLIRQPRKVIRSVSGRGDVNPQYDVPRQGEMALMQRIDERHFIQSRISSYALGGDRISLPVMATLRRSRIWLSFVLMLSMLCHFGFEHRDASAFVLCFGADGHVAVEPAGHVHGTEANQRAPAEAETGAHSADGDLPCWDIPVVDDHHGAHVPLAGASKPSLDPGLLSLVCFVVLLIPYTRAVLRRPRFRDPPKSDARLLALRTVVLLN